MTQARAVGVAIVITLASGVALPHRVSAQECQVHLTVTPEQLRNAMRRHGDYDVKATMNAARFGAEVVLELAREAQSQHPDAGPLVIRQDDWFDAYLEVAGITADDAPIGAKMAFQHQQDMQIEYRRNRVLATTPDSTAPPTALAIQAWWRDGPDTYGYKDSLSIPPLKVSFERVITYRLLDFGDMIVYDSMTGMAGKPTTGAWGVLFSIIGLAQILQSRLAVSDDGLQLLRVSGKKWGFPKSSTVTIQRDGRGASGAPKKRPDLKPIETRLQAPLQIHYAPMSC